VEARSLWLCAALRPTSERARRGRRGGERRLDPGGDEALVVDVAAGAGERSAHRVIGRRRFDQDQRQRVHVGLFSRAGEALLKPRVELLVLCSVADVQAALAELLRVLRPNGELRLFKNVASPRRARRVVQRAADVTVWPRLSGGCDLARETERLIEEAGFAIERCDRFSFRIRPMDPPKTHILGVARRTQAPGSRPVR
jgi:SAM-dependent methyltransferase